MRARLKELWQARAPRERLVIAALAAIIAVTLYLWLLTSAGRARQQLTASVAVLQAQAARLDRDAGELLRLRGLPATPPTQGELRGLVQAQASAAGLASALQRIDTPDANQAQVVLGAAAFADWLELVAKLQAQRVRVDACRIEALSTPGLVSVTATLVRARPK